MNLDLITIAARLVAEIGNKADLDARAIAAAWRAGYRAGFTAGEDVGYGRAHAEIERDWSRLAEKVRATANRPTLAELQERRMQPGGEIYLAALNRRGEYRGGPVEWDTSEERQGAA